jgi:hypothetical protein
MGNLICPETAKKHPYWLLYLTAYCENEWSALCVRTVVPNMAFTCLYNSLADEEAQSYSHLIETLGRLQLTKKFEQFILIFRTYTSSGVSNIESKDVTLLGVVNNDSNDTSTSELYSIRNQVK